MSSVPRATVSRPTLKPKTRKREKPSAYWVGVGKKPKRPKNLNLFLNP